MFEMILLGQSVTQVLGNCVDVLVFRPLYSAQAEFKRSVCGSFCVSVSLFDLFARGRLTSNRCANVIGSLSIGA